MDFLTERYNIVPLLAPIDTVTTAYATPYVDLAEAHESIFFVYAGVITTASSDDTSGAVITVEAATAAASAATEAAIGFNYRISAATGTNTWGAVSTATTTGYEFPLDGDGMLLEIAVDHADVANAITSGVDGRYVRLVVTPNAQATAFNVSIWAVQQPRYKQATMIASC